LNASSLLEDEENCVTKNKQGQQGVKLVHLKNANSDCQTIKVDIRILVAARRHALATQAKSTQNLS
jgi:hypothetical protein